MPLQCYAETLYHRVPIKILVFYTADGERPGTLSNKIGKAVGDKEDRKCWTLAIVKKGQTSGGQSAATLWTPLLSLMQLAEGRYFQLNLSERTREIILLKNSCPDYFPVTGPVTRDAPLMFNRYIPSLNI